MRRGAGWSCSDCCALMIRLSSTWCSWSASARIGGMSLAKIERHLDAARANRVAGDVERRRHDVVDRHRAAFGLLLPRHGEERAHDARAALGGRADLQRRATCVAESPCSSSSTARATTTESGLLSSCATPASSEPSAASFSRWYKRLALPRQLLGGALLLGDVARDRQHVGLALVLHRDAVHLELQRGAVAARCAVHLRVQRFAGRDRARGTRG